MHTATCPRCGFVTKARPTAALAAYSLSRHSCATHRAAQERQERIRARDEARTGPPQPCTHLDSDGVERHPHGSYLRYVSDRCRCRECRAGNLAYDRRRVRMRAYGRGTPTGLTDATPVREHVLTLRAAGMGWKCIADASGIESRLLWRIAGAPQDRLARRVTRATADALLGVSPTASNGVLVCGHGTRLRLRALAAAGWSFAAVAQRVGCSRMSLTRAVQDGPVRVRKGTADKVREGYERLWDQAPDVPSQVASRTRNAAAVRGWVPPMGLDDDRIDDPTYEPDPSVVPARRRREPAVNMDAVEDLAGCGLDSDEVAARLGVSRDAVTVACRRNGRGDLVVLLDNNRDRRAVGRWIA